MALKAVLSAVTVWLLAFFLGAGVQMAAGSCFPSPTGLVGWWPGDGNANNVLGTNHGTLQGGATANAVGVVGSAFIFDGTNNYVQVPDAAILKPTNLTVEAWVRFSALDSGGTAAPIGVQYIVFKQNSRSGDFEGFSLVKERITGSDHFTFQVTSATGVGVDVTSSSLISTGVWYHVACVRGSNFIQLFVNGQLERQTNVAFAQDYGVLPMYFGTTGQSFWDRKFRGTLDEVTLYNRAVSSNEIAAVYAAGAEGKCKVAGIAASPQSQSVVVGSNAVFNVTATGFGALSYQWRFNGTNLAGATSTNLTLTGVQLTNAGNYTVVVTNALGSATSAVAVLTVLIPPAITAQPQSRTNVAGTDASFTMMATGTALLSYQWRFNATNIPGATATNYTRANVQPADAGSYTVVVTNAGGAITSAVASLVVKSPPALPAQTSRTIAELSTLTVTNTASDSDTPASGLTYALPVAPVNAAISTNGVITWTPTEAQGPGTNVITTVVTDSDGLSATNSFTVIVTEVNTAPALSAAANYTLAELATLSVTNSATDSDSPANTLTYSLLTAPFGATVNPSTGVISWTPTEAQGPSVSNAFTMRVVDDGVPALSTTNTFYVTVTEVNDAPLLAAQTNRTVAELTLLTVTNSATDGDVPANALSYALTGPGTAQITTDGVITWTPSEADGPGVFTFTTIVSDGSLSATNSFSVTVTEVNVVPVLPGQVNRTIAELTTLSVTNTAADGDVPTNLLSYTLTGPATAVINPNTGVITWTPGEADGPGATVFTTVVSDGNLSVTNAFTVTVTEANLAPVLPTQTNWTIVELTQLTVTNTATDGDVPANTLTYTLTGPATAQITTNGVITWTPGEADGPGTNVFTTVVSDGSLSATNSFTVTVTEVNSAPVLPAQTNRTMAELTLLTVTNAATDGDVPVNTLTYSLLAAPSGTTINPNTGVINWTPTEAQGPSVSNAFTMRVVDDGTLALSATNTFYVTVTEVNISPVASNESYNLGLNGTLSVAAPGVLANDTDADLPANTLSAVLVSGPTNGTLTLTNNGGFRYTPANNFFGTDTFTYRANDGQANSAIATVAFTIASVSSLPFADDFTRGSDPGLLTPWVTNAGNWSVSGGIFNGGTNPPAAGYGFAYVGNNWTDFALSGRIRFEADSFGGGLGGRLNPLTGTHYAAWVYPEGSGGGSNVLRLIKFSSWTNFTQLDGTVDLAAVGTNWHNLKLAFRGGQIAVYFDSVLVLSVADESPFLTGGISADLWTAATPYVLGVDDVLVSALAADDSYALGPGVPFNVAAPGVLGNDTAVYGNALTAALLSSPAHGSLTLTNNGGFTYTPTNGYLGLDSFAYTLAEGGTNVGSASVTLTVSSGNHAPALAAQTNRAVAELSVLTVTNSATDPDALDVLTYGLAVAPAGAGINASNGVIIWPPGEADGPGVFSFTTVVSDGNLSATNSFFVTVTEVNVAPVLPVPVNWTVSQGSLLSVANAGSDGDVPANGLSYQLLNAPSGAVISGSGVITWTPGAGQPPGVYGLTTVVTDDGVPGLSGTNSFTVMVVAGNVPPAITSQPVSATNVVGSTAVFSVGATGTPVLGYQWRKAGTNVAGGTGSDLTLVNVTTNGAGDYAVVVTNGFGSVTSAVAVLTVVLPGMLPDPNLSNAVYVALGKTNGTLTAVDLGTLTNLYADFRNITNVSGLELASNLMHLTLSGNSISDLTPLAGLGQLRSLELENKNYQRFSALTPLAGLTNLTSLVLGGNPLYDLSAFAGLTNLTTLSLPRSSLTNLSGVQFLSRLACLAIYENMVVDVSPLAGLTNLTQLDVRQNPVSNYVVLAGFTNLNRLCVGWNYGVTNVGFLQNLRKLNWLDLGYSGVGDLLPLGNLTNLTYLVLSGNPATNYNALANLTGLVNLELHGNTVTNSSFLTNFNRLAYADLYQSVTNLPPLAGLTNLSSLVLAGVPNYTSLTNLNLTNLWVTGSSVSNATFFTSLTRLRHLVLNDNFISNPAPLQALPNLTSLGLSRNPGLNYTNLVGFTNLTSLLLDGYTITNLIFLDNLKRLESLSLRQSRLSTLTGLEALTNLVSMYAERGRLTNVTACLSLPKLRFVGLTGNLLDTNSTSAAMTVINGLKGWGVNWRGRGAQVDYLPQNQPPAFSIATNWFVAMNISSSLAFGLTDDYTPNNQLLLTTSTSSPGLIPNANLSLGGTNLNRILMVTPVTNETGAATITIIATDEAGTSAVVPVQVVVVPPTSLSNLCPNLDANLVSAISLASGTPVAELTLIDLLRLENLSVYNANLTNTCVWTWATNLTSLYLSSNAVNNLNFLTNLPKLTSLGLNRNTTVDLAPIASLTNLTALNLSGNSLSNLNFLQSFTGLRNLVLYDNKITALAPVSGLTNLYLLSLQRNLLTQVGVLTNLPQLSLLDLTMNLLDLTNGSPARSVISYLTNGGTAVLASPQWQPPRIDVRTNWVINVNATAAVPFSVTNGDTGGGLVRVGAVAANPGLLPSASATVSAGGIGVLSVTSAANQAIGTTFVTLNATNEVGLRASVAVTVTVTAFVPVNSDLLNNPNLTWTGSGNALWFGQSLVTHDGVSAAQSGTIGDNEQSKLETSVVGPGVLTYWRKISSETNFDYLELYLNDELQPNRISGEVNWEQQVVTVPLGTQVLRWQYTKDKDSSFGADAAWLDEVTFVSLSWLELTRGPTNGFPMQLTLHVTPNELYEVLHSTNLVNWLSFGPVTATNSEMLIFDTNVLSNRRFYRLRDLGPLPP